MRIWEKNQRNQIETDKEPTQRGLKGEKGGAEEGPHRTTTTGITSERKGLEKKG